MVSPFASLSPLNMKSLMFAKWSPVKAHEPLRVSLVDLRSAETKGKWWLVGAGWAGDPLVDQDLDKQRAIVNSQEAGTATENKTTEKLLQLAKKQGMNTDVRRSVFVVLMTSDVRVLHPHFFLAWC